MQAYEFYTKAKDGVIPIPEQYKNQITENILVIVLEKKPVILNHAKDSARKKTDLLSLPSLNTKGWKFSREEANARQSVFGHEYYLDEIESICEDVMLIHRKTIDLAMDIKDRYGYSFFDCVMLASAIEANCTLILTEDMQDGQGINGTLKITNPFNHAK